MAAADRKSQTVSYLFTAALYTVQDLHWQDLHLYRTVFLAAAFQIAAATVTVL